MTRLVTSLQELLNSRDEGYGKLQQVIDQAHLVLPNTSAVGKDTINEDLASLRQNWDDLTNRLNTGKTQLEMATSQWGFHEESISQLGKWLTETENCVKVESTQQATLPEKRSQLERIKVLTMNVSSQQPSFAALKERAESLAEATHDTHMATEATQHMKRYQSLADSVKVSGDSCSLIFRSRNCR